MYDLRNVQPGKGYIIVYLCLLYEFQSERPSDLVEVQNSDGQVHLYICKCFSLF